MRRRVRRLLGFADIDCPACKGTGDHYVQRLRWRGRWRLATIRCRRCKGAGRI